MPTAKVGEQSRLVKMKSTAKMQVYFELAKEKRRFFCLLYNRKLFINTSTIICFNEGDNEDTPACE